MASFLVSVGDFLWGIIKRFWLLLPSFLLDPLDLYERYFHRPAPVNIPDWAFYLVFGFSVFLAATLTYHEVRVRVGAVDAGRKVRTILAAFHAEGQRILQTVFDAPDNPAAPYRGAMDRWKKTVVTWLIANGFPDGAVVFGAAPTIVSTLHHSRTSGQEASGQEFLPQTAEHVVQAMAEYLKRLSEIMQRVSV